MKALILPLILMLSCFQHEARAQNTLWDIIYCLNGGENKSAGIAKLAEPNPPEKPGWNLIFQDEFTSDSLNPDKWNRSTPWDDGSGSCVRGFAVNPVNPSVEPESARISNTIDSFLPGCPYSGGEIKTMSVADRNFNSFYFYAPGYVEARVRLFNKKGQGAAFWLWGVGTPEDPGTPGPWNEIDIFELNGVNNNIFNATYHWTYDEVHVSQIHSIYLTETAQPYDLSSNWTTFGLEWDTASIKWYVNNALVKELDLHPVPPFCIGTPIYGQPLSPFCIRFSTGNNSVGNQSAMADPADFPQSMLIDYIRAYKRADQKAAPIIIRDNLNQICATATNYTSAEKIIRTHYYPGAIYAWSSPAFELAPDSGEFIPEPPEKMRIWIKDGIPTGQNYPLYLHTVFPDGFAEYDTAYLYVAPDVPPMPAGHFQAVQIDTLCYYQIEATLHPDASGSEFSLDNGSTWSDGSLFIDKGVTLCRFGKFKPDSIVAFSYREKNRCGTSPVRITSLTMPSPSPGCNWPYSVDDPAWNPSGEHKLQVTVTPNPVSELLHIKLGHTPTPQTHDLRLYIYDIHERCILHESLVHQESQFALGHLPPGIYCMLISQNNRIQYKSTFLKN